MNGIGKLFGAIDATFRNLGSGVRNSLTNLTSGPLQGVLFAAVLALTGVVVIIQSTWKWLDKGLGWLERGLIVVATLGMTFLVFNSYLIEQVPALLPAPSAPEEAPADEATSTDASSTPEEAPPEAPAEVDAPQPPEPVLGPATVTLTGDASSVSITGEAGTFDLPGEVPAGTYQASALFDGYDSSIDAGELELTGGELEVKCVSFAEACRVRQPKPAATAAPTGDQAESGMVELKGDAVGVELKAETETYPVPGPVPPGEYTAIATFEGYDAPIDAGMVTIPAGPVTLKCVSNYESCRIPKPKVASSVAQNANPETAPEPEAKLHMVSVTVRGDGTNHHVLAPERIDLPGDVPVGSWTIMADFGERTNVVSGTLELAEDQDTAGLWCSATTWQCLPDAGWWNPWQAEGQVNLALMLMVALGFLGASIATQEGNHLSVDAASRVLSPQSAKFVRRVTAAVAAGFCTIMAYATWMKITDPDASGDTFPGAKVWWWMAQPLNALTNLMPGDTFGPGGAYPTRTAWEDAMIEQGLEWPFGLAYETVQIGSAFPLWVSLLVLVVAFGTMALRFGAIAISPPPLPTPDLPTKPRPTSRRPADVVLAGAFPGAVIALGLAVWLGEEWMIIVASLLLVFMGAPLFIGVGIGTLAGWMLIQDVSAASLVSDMFEATKKQEIIAIPFFVLAGNLMTHGSIARRLIDFARAVVGKTPGGLAVAGVVACAIFAAISGSSPATVIAIGAILFPMLVKQGYDEEFGLGLLTTSGGLGIIIPPSVPMIIFAVMVSNPGGIVGVVSPVDLFLGGFGPGILIAGALIAYTLYRNWPRPGQEAGPLPPGSDPDDTLTGNYFPDLGNTFIRGLFSILLPIVVLGGIYGGALGSPFVMDVTQAAAFAVVYALVVEVLVHRELSLKDVPKVCIETASMIGSLFLILVIAISLNKLLAELGVPEAAAQAMLAWADDPLTFLLLVNIFLLLLGTVMDIVSAILIVAPLLAPIAAQYGIHPIHFGIMFIVNLELGYLTPPMGINLFVASTTFKRNLVQVIRGVAPFLVLMLVCLAAIIWLPRWFHSAGLPIPGLPAYLETQVATSVAEGPRPNSEISQAVRKELADLRACAPSDITRRGEGVFTLVVPAEGGSAEVTPAGEATLEGDNTEQCLVDALRAVQFGPLEDGTSTTASVTISHMP